MPETVITIQDVIRWIHSSAEDTDLDAIHRAVRARDRALRDVRAASVSLHGYVELAGLSPKYLNGLKGTVVSIKGSRADIQLDAECAWQARGRDINGTLYGVPLSCMTVLSRTLS